jgi:hypothetical protein
MPLFLMREKREPDLNAREESDLQNNNNNNIKKKKKNGQFASKITTKTRIPKRV